MPKFCEEVKQPQHVNQKSSLPPKANHSEFGTLQSYTKYN